MNMYYIYLVTFSHYLVACTNYKDIHHNLQTFAQTF